MLLIKTRLGQSAIHGIGVFADEDLAKGTVLWKFVAPFDVYVHPDELSRLSTGALAHFIKYSYLHPDKGLYVLCGDDARFYNHADDPNSIEGYAPDEPEGVDVAARDIARGEELTCDYTTFDANWAKGIRT